MGVWMDCLKQWQAVQLTASASMFEHMSCLSLHSQAQYWPNERCAATVWASGCTKHGNSETRLSTAALRQKTTIHDSKTA